MKKFLIISLILLWAFKVGAEEGLKAFTPTQKKMLEAKVLNEKIAQNSTREFLSYLQAEYEVDNTYQITPDLSGFKKMPPKPEPKPEEKKDA